ncbi:MAG: hypothetical protein K8R58_04140, partial [Bacteroidales bacterium]|nr:hypothetical protein [Bacteroidales bacterium]
MKKIQFFTGVVILMFVVITAQTQNSVLSESNWYKIAVEQTGIHQITFDDLVSYGINPTSINPKHIRLYGNGNGMLTEPNNEFRYDDLQENAIFVYGEDDEVFDPGDFILFYGEGPTEWTFNEETNLFEHQVNYYSDYSYFFLTTNLGIGKRIEEQSSSTANPTHYVQSFNNYSYNELEELNLIKSGKEWFGEEFNETLTYTFSYNIPNLSASDSVIMDISLASRSFVNASFEIKVNDQIIDNLSIVSVNLTSCTYAREKNKTYTFIADNENIEVELTYDKPEEESIGWLNYLRLNVRKKLIVTDSQMLFRDMESVGAGYISKFEIENVSQNFSVWEISDPINIKTQLSEKNFKDQFSFILQTDSLKEFIAFDHSEFFTPSFIGQIENQNLHGLQPVDLIIITHENFINAAQQLANFHESHDGLSTIVVTPDIIYNEFSSGAQDITA